MSEREYREEVHMGAQGRLVIPSKLRRQLGLHHGDTLIARSEQGRLVVEKMDLIRKRLKSRYARIPNNRSLSRELVAERRAEAKRDAGK
jgi:AbrB family looped-hinge helix DNA binding protein